MGSAAANAPLAISVLSTQRLYYDIKVHAGVGIFLVFSSQCLGYGIAGLLRRTLVYPTNMLWPINLPMNTLLEALHGGDKLAIKKKLRVFYIGFCTLFFYEIIPEWIMPILNGISPFCLANRNSAFFTNFFGGSNGNEGMGVLALSLDWQYIANPSPLWYPLQTLNNNFVGYLLCIVVFCGVYYGNIWESRKFPFLSQSLFTAASNGTYFEEFNQTAVLTPDFKVDPVLLAQQGLPYFTGTFAIFILATNLSITSTFSHLLLWNFDDMKSAWSFLSPSSLKKFFTNIPWAFWREQAPGEDDEDDISDPHYRLMKAYKDAPNVSFLSPARVHVLTNLKWWYFGVLLLSVAIGLPMLYLAKSTLPWYVMLQRMFP
jgi:hypothetical protein